MDILVPTSTTDIQSTRLAATPHVPGSVDPNRLTTLANANIGGNSGNPPMPGPVDPDRVMRLVPAPGSKEAYLHRYIASEGTGVISNNSNVDTSHIVPKYRVTHGGPTNQKASGRCWIFAGLNAMRVPVLKKYGKNFAYSQNYVAFWDKVERANFFLEKMMEMKELEPSDHRLLHLIDNCFADGGEWELFVNVVDKYGVVPQEAMPETSFSGSSGGYMAVLKEYLRDIGGVLHQKAAAGASNDELQQLKLEALDKVNSVLMKYLGAPPKSFLFAGADGTLQETTPLEFRAENPMNLRDKVHLVNLSYHPKGTMIGVKDVGNQVDGLRMRALNTDMTMIKEAIRNSIKGGESVDVASEVKQLDRKKGIFALDATEQDAILGLDGGPTLEKGDRLRYRSTCVAHGMVITGCDEANARRAPEGAEGYSELYTGPVWQFENSWEGMESILVSDKWFDEFVYGVVVDKQFLPTNLKEQYESSETPLKMVPAWDPFGRI